MMRAVSRATLALSCVLALAPTPCFADSVFLNAEGQRNIALIRQRIAPGVILEHPDKKLPYIRCVIVGERPARNVLARYDTVEGTPEYDIVAFDATGDRRSQPATISQAWIDHFDPDLDSDLDVRRLFSNRDERAGIPLGSRAYFAMARRAGDPTGALGLWRNDMDLPPEPAGVREGGIVHFLRDPYVSGPADAAAAWNARRKARADAIIKEGLAKRLPMWHGLTWDVRPSRVATELTEAIARERAYRLSRTGFDRTALAMLVFMFDLAVVKNTGTAANTIAGEGRWSVTHAIDLIGMAGPKRPGDGRDCAATTPFCPDISQRAAAVMDGLLASEGVFAMPGYSAVLVRNLLNMYDTPATAIGPARKVDLRDAAMKLLVHALKPPPGRDPASQQRREAYAREARRALHGILLEEEKHPGQHAAARAALAATGWGTAEELDRLVRLLLSNAESFAGDAWRARGSSAQWPRRRAAERIVTLRALVTLAASQAAHERSAAAVILKRVEEIRKEMGGPTADGSERVFLEIWDSLASKRR